MDKPLAVNPRDEPLARPQFVSRVSDVVRRGGLTSNGRPARPYRLALSWERLGKF